jgi:hypothetical protein
VTKVEGELANLSADRIEAGRTVLRRYLPAVHAYIEGLEAVEPPPACRGLMAAVLREERTVPRTLAAGLRAYESGDRSAAAAYDATQKRFEARLLSNLETAGDEAAAEGCKEPSG